MAQRIEYDEEMVGNGHPTKSDTLNRLPNLFTATTGGLLVGAGEATAEYRIFPKFSAHKNGTNQEDIATGVWTKVTFTTEEYDVGGVYDAVNSKWLPGIVGKVHIDAAITYVAGVDQTSIFVAVYLNGVIYKSKLTRASGAAAIAVDISCDVAVAVITDYIEIYTQQNSAGDQDVNGPATSTFFMGHFLP